MIIPIRCFTCGKPIAQDWEKYYDRVENKKENPKDVLDDLGYTRYCCRRMFLGNVELIDEIVHFKKF